MATPVANSTPSPLTKSKHVKNIVGSKKALPHGGSATKFHKARKGGSHHHHAAIDIRHGSLPARNKRGTRRGQTFEGPVRAARSAFINLRGLCRQAQHLLLIDDLLDSPKTRFKHCLEIDSVHPAFDCDGG
jgi:hypothetical protein